MAWERDTIRSSLTSKGFALDTDRDHEVLTLQVPGVRPNRAIWTKLSRGMKYRVYGDGLLSDMSHQLQVTRRQLDRLMAAICRKRSTSPTSVPAICSTRRVARRGASVYPVCMPKRSRNTPPADPNEAAFLAVQRLTGGDLSPEDARREAARLLGSLGGRIGGPARAKALSAKRRKAIAKKAAMTRWHKEG